MKVEGILKAWCDVGSQGDMAEVVKRAGASAMCTVCSDPLLLEVSGQQDGFMIG